MKPHIRSKHPSISWLGPIPEHWGFARGKTLFRREKREPLNDDGVVTCFRDGLVTLRSNRRLTGYTEAIQEHGYQGIRKGDLVIHAMDAFAGAVGVSDSDGKSSPVYAACTPRKAANAHYYAAVVREMARTGWIAALSRGVRERSTDFRFESFANQLLPVPPVEEQAAIVKYLGHAHTRIDRAIAAKRKLIALLEEQNQVILHSAVTRGLDSSAPLRDSGIPWIGEFPAHWELKPAGRLFRAVTRPVGEEILPQYSMTRARGLVPTDSANSSSLQAADLSNFQTCEVGDFVLNKYRAHLGLFRGVRERGLVTKNYTNFRRTTELNDEFFEALFQDSTYSDGFRINARGVGDGMSPLYTSTFYGIPVLTPPLTEQEQIAETVRVAVDGLGKLKSRTAREVELLREFRTRLTSDVVTGRIDIRDLAASLSDLTERVHVRADDVFTDDESIEFETKVEPEFACADE